MHLLLFGNPIGTISTKLGNAGLIRDQRYRTEPWCRNADTGLMELTTGRNADAGAAGLTFLRHLYMIFQYHIARKILSALSTTCNLDVHWVSLSQPPKPAVWMCRVYRFLKMPECRTVRHPVSPVPEWTKMLMPEPFQYRNKRTQSGTGMLRYRTEIQDAGMPIPAASTSMPMPCYAFHTVSIDSKRDPRSFTPLLPSAVREKFPWHLSQIHWEIENK